MKLGWQKRTLAELCQVKPPKSEARERVVPDGLVSFVPMEDLGIERKFVNPRQIRTLASVAGSYTYFADGDVLLAKITPCFENGKLGIANALSNGIGFGSSEFIVFRPCANLNSEFLYYYLSRSDFRKEGSDRMGGAVGHQRVPKEFIESYPIVIPPLPEQHRIVGILDEAFEGIATAKANGEKNLQNSRALFESHLQSVFTYRGKGWKKERIGALTHLARGHNPPKSKFSPQPKPGYVRFYQIRDGGTDDYAVYVPDTPQLHKMKPDDIMMVAYRHVGRVFRGVSGAFNVALCKISNARRDLLNDDYLFHIIPSCYVKGELLKRSERSLIPSMSIEHLRELEIPLPPLREQQRIVESIKSLSTETQRLEAIYQQKLVALEELKKALLHQAFKGQL
ncbi:MAG: restriction endonuclease subunit S [Desulfomonilaceae bacterium]|jgi:type I restriction enzyme S subunit